MQNAQLVVYQVTNENHSALSLGIKYDILHQKTVGVCVDINKRMSVR